ncbi:MAG: PQQ-binding-like beta-propeller repeat protein [Actinocatenispora sp.]
MTTNPLLWTTAVPEDTGGHLAVLPDGRVLVSGRRFVAVVRPAGEIDWLVGSTAGVIGAPVLLPDGHITRYEDGVLVTRDPGSGATVAGFDAPGLTGVTATGDGELLYDSRDGDGTPWLRCSTADGAPEWSAPLVGPPPSAPVVTDQVVVADGPLLRGYDRAGEPLWIAGEGGFAAPRSAPGTVAGGTVRGGLVPLPDGLLLTELSTPSGAAFHVVDPGRRTVRPLGPALSVRAPAAVVDGRLALLGAAEELEREQWLASVVLVETSGTVRWRHRLAAEPTALLGVAGGLLVLASPPEDRWQRYHGWQDLTDQCFVRYLDGTGEPRWTWHPPAPLPYRPAADPAGTCYVAASGRLYALDGRRTV